MGNNALFLFAFERMHNTMSQQDLSEDIIEEIRSICRQHRAELIDYTLRGSKSARILELFIDNYDGVTHDLCQAISTEVELLLDSNPTRLSIARLDVSSPGVERPLAFPWQYPKHQGRLLAVHTTSGQVYTGYLRSVSEAAITLECKSEIVTLPFPIIDKAFVQLEW